MSDLTELYQEVILDHGKRPRNMRAMEDADRTAEGFNPLCGDRVTVYLRLGNGRIGEITFSGAGCAICMASASMMTQRLAGLSGDEARSIFVSFKRLVTGGPEPQGADAEEIDLGSLLALAGVRKFPMRIKCATLPWHTMRAALEGEDREVSTEE